MNVRRRPHSELIEAVERAYLELRQVEETIGRGAAKEDLERRALEVECQCATGTCLDLLKRLRRWGSATKPALEDAPTA